MDDRKTIPVWTLIVVIILVIGGVYVWSNTSQDEALPIVGKVNFNLFGSTQIETFDFEIEPFFGYRSSPQYYNVNLEPIEIRALINNTSDAQASEQIELKVYRFDELWDTRTHTISYDSRNEYVNAQPQDQTDLFSETQLSNIVHSGDICGEGALNSSMDGPCYHEVNPDDNYNTYAGYRLDPKPTYVSISDAISLTPSERYTFIDDWTPNECGYFKVILQPFGYSGQGEEGVVQEAYLRVIGCDMGNIIENGSVEGTSTQNGGAASIVNTELPGTGKGFPIAYVSAFMVLVGGLVMNKGLKGMRIK